MSACAPVSKPVFPPDSLNVLIYAVEQVEKGTNEVSLPLLSPRCDEPSVSSVNSAKTSKNTCSQQLQARETRYCSLGKFATQANQNRERKVENRKRKSTLKNRQTEIDGRTSIAELLNQTALRDVSDVNSTVENFLHSEDSEGNNEYCKPSPIHSASVAKGSGSHNNRETLTDILNRATCIKSKLTELRDVTFQDHLISLIEQFMSAVESGMAVSDVIHSQSRQADAELISKDDKQRKVKDDLQCRIKDEPGSPATNQQEDLHYVPASGSMDQLITPDVENYESAAAQNGAAVYGKLGVESRKANIGRKVNTQNLDKIIRSLNPHIEDKADDSNKSELMSCKLCEAAQPSPECTAPNGEMIKKFPDWSSLMEHLKTTHREFDSGYLEKDGFRLSENSMMIDNNGEAVESHKVIKKYSRLCCPKCLKTKSARDNLKDAYASLCFHMYEKHNEKLPAYFPLHLCPKCPYKTLSKKLMQAHVEYNHSASKSARNQRITCTVCEKSVLQRFMCKHLLVKHNISTSEAPIKDIVHNHKCPKCCKVIRGKSNLERHIQRVHDQERNYLCHLCSSRFFVKKELINHMFHQHEVNLENKPVLSCSVNNCNFRAVTKDILSKHYKVHHSERSFMCSTCSKTFKTIYNLKQHENCTHGVAGEMYKCAVAECDYTSSSKQYVKRHMKIHNDIKRHRCSFPGCNYTSHFSENVKKHSKMHMNEKSCKRRKRGDHKQNDSSNLLVDLSTCMDQTFQMESANDIFISPFK